MILLGGTKEGNPEESRGARRESQQVDLPMRIA
jgi:hypothetical protein